MPFAIGGNQLDTGYEVSNSIYINRSNGGRLAKTFSGTATDRQKNTVSFWVKRCRLTTGSGTGHQVIFSNQDNDQIRFDGSTDQLSFVSAGTMKIRTNRVFRDVSAWYHIVFAMDTTQSTGTDRIKFYVNGVQETSFETYNAVTQNINHSFFMDQDHDIGRSHSDANRHYDGYICEFNGIDGQQLLPTEFGEFNDNGVWIPKKYQGTYGNNGFFLEFKQTGTSADASGKGADTSGNGHHFDDNSINVEEVKTDTCTNNFCTLNPLSAGSDLRANGSFRQGNLELTNGGTTGQSNGQKCQGTMGFANGKWYWEVKLISNTMTAGIVDSDIQTSSDINLGSKNAVTYDSETGNVNNSSGTVYTGSTYDDGDIIGVAVDADNGAVYFAKNNTYQNSGNPASGASKTGGATFTLGNYMLPLMADNSSGSQGNHQYNFGNAPFSISSGNSDSEGHGNFEHAPPSGYFALCTKNLAEYG